MLSRRPLNPVSRPLSSVLCLLLPAFRPRLAMKRLSIALVLFLAAFPVLPARAATNEAGGRPVRIMPLGDSITQGEAGNSSYRRPLWKKLSGDGILVDFVGSMHSTRPAPPDFVTRWKPAFEKSDDEPADYDADHEGHWGWRAHGVVSMIDEWAAAAVPDVVLMHLGTNDFGEEPGKKGTAGEIAQIIAGLRRHSTNVVVLLARIIPVNDEDADKWITAYNRELAALAVELNTTTQRVVIVDQHSGFDALKDTVDGVHPNSSGAEKMAEKWRQALRPFLPSTVGPNPPQKKM